MVKVHSAQDRVELTKKTVRVTVRVVHFLWKRRLKTPSGLEKFHAIYFLCLGAEIKWQIKEIHYFQFFLFYFLVNSIILVGAFINKSARLLQSLIFLLGVGKNFRLLMQSCCFFFSPDLFMKISNFSKTVHTIFTKCCTVILHPKGPLRVQRHQNRMAGMWET